MGFLEFDALRYAGGPSHIFIPNASTHGPAPPSAVPANPKSNASENQDSFPEFYARPCQRCDGKQVQTRDPHGYVPSSISKVDPEATGKHHPMRQCHEYLKSSLNSFGTSRSSSLFWNWSDDDGCDAGLGGVEFAGAFGQRADGGEFIVAQSVGEATKSPA